MNFSQIIKYKNNIIYDTKYKSPRNLYLRVLTLYEDKLTIHTKPIQKPSNPSYICINRLK